MTKLITEWLAEIQRLGEDRTKIIIVWNYQIFPHVNELRHDRALSSQAPVLDVELCRETAENRKPLATEACKFSQRVCRVTLNPRRRQKLSRTCYQSTSRRGSLNDDDDDGDTTRRTCQKSPSRAQRGRNTVCMCACVCVCGCVHCCPLKRNAVSLFAVHH